MQQIGRGIFFEDSYLGVTLGALVLPQGIILIDAPLRAEDARSWRSSLVNQRGGSNRLLVSLDAHLDRTLGARALDCTVVSHQKAAQVFRNRPTIFKGQGVESGSDWETYDDAIGIRWVSPDITFSEQMSLHWGGAEVILKYHPGPTPGSIWVSIPEAHVVFVGDTVILGQPPFLSFADLEPWIESLDLLMQSYQDYVIVSGRGGPATMEDIRFQQRILKDILEGVERLAKKNTGPEGTESLVGPLLAKYKFSPDLRERYIQRLQYGLYQCFVRRYRPSALGQLDVDSEEQ